MNVQREIDAANRRIQEQIDASARAALIRIGVDVEAMEREEAEARAQAALEFVETWGAAWGTLLNAIIEITEAFAAGVASAFELEERP